MRQEHPTRPDLNPEIVEAYANTFISRFDTYPIQNADGSYVRVKRPLVPAVIEGHLKGHITIGAYALTENSQAHWICLDADDENHAFELSYMTTSLAQKDVPSYLELSRRGCHLWLFTPPLSGLNARRFGKQLLKEYHIEGVELYPKQDYLTTGTGSLVRLPLGVHQMTKRRYHYVKQDGSPLADTIREQMALLSNPERVSGSFINMVLAHAPEATVIFPTKRFVTRPKSHIVGDTLSKRIKNRISVYDFVNQYVELNNSGFGCCPFHDDHKMSFGVNEDGNYWHCFACDIGGSVIDFWMQ